MTGPVRTTTLGRRHERTGDVELVSWRSRAGDRPAWAAAVSIACGAGPHSQVSMSCQQAKSSRANAAHPTLDPIDGPQYSRYHLIIWGGATRRRRSGAAATRTNEMRTSR